MMKRSFSALQLDGHRSEGFELFRIEDRLDRAHISGQSGYRQQIPSMAAGHIAKTAVVAGRVVKRYEARQVRHRLSSSPVRIILMPRDYGAMTRRLAEELIVPEPD